MNKIIEKYDEKINEYLKEITRLNDRIGIIEQTIIKLREEVVEKILINEEYLPLPLNKDDNLIGRKMSKITYITKEGEIHDSQSDKDNKWTFDEDGNLYLKDENYEFKFVNGEYELIDLSDSSTYGTIAIIGLADYELIEEEEK